MDECWRAGDLQHLLDSNQLGIYTLILACAVLQFVIEAGRKVGKSWLLAVIAFEAALRHPGGRINYAAPTGKEAVEITLPIMKQLAVLAPDDCRPVWLPSKGHWEFPNGAFIVLFGADDEATADKGRGPEAVVNIVDEGGFTPVLMYLLESVLAPQTLQALSAAGMFAKAPSPWLGRTLLASSAPVSPGHDFAEIADAALAQGAYVHRDVYSHGRMTREEIDAYLTQRAQSRNMTLAQFKATSDFLREYMALRIIDSNLAVVPEFARARDGALAVAETATTPATPAFESIIIPTPNLPTVILPSSRKELVRPPFFDLYFAGDPGMSDLFGGLFAYLDFRRNRLVIEHELLLAKANTKTFAGEFQRVLIENYPCEQEDPRSMRMVTAADAFNVFKPHSAVLDTTTAKSICSDLFSYHGLHFSPAQTDDRESSINVMRLEVASRIEIHPRCEGLIRQLGTAVRTKPGGDMARNKRDGHYDLISSLRYLVRSINWAHNPFPAGYGFDSTTMARRELPRRTRTMADVLNGR